MGSKTTIALTPEQIQFAERSGWRKLPMIAGAVGLAGLGATAALGMGDNAKGALFSYLVAFCFFLSISIGAAFFVLIQHLVRAGWSVGVRRVFEGLMAPMPLFLVLFVPIALGMGKLYKWAKMELGVDPLFDAKVGYLNAPFFLGRSAFYLIVFAAVGYFFLRASTQQDKSGDLSISERLRWQSAPALMLLTLATTFAAFDWMMTLDFHWYSTIYGVYYFAGSFVTAIAVATVFCLLFRRAGLLGPAFTVEHQHDLGKLLFGFMVFWTYIAFSQYFLLWYANIPETTIYFQFRLHTEWLSWSILLAVGHFLLPFIFLMARSVKRIDNLLLIGALWLVAMHFVDMYWNIMPNLDFRKPPVSLTDLTAFLGVGGLFFAIVGGFFNKNNLVAVKDPRLGEALTFENF